ncbi:hypothetical protein [Pseudomonas sp. NMI4491_12]|uniref:hypothetical protein n=1 Tax=Pseudomonas sp. NMI4491_12 TaxID=2903146 RepID=UPI001E4D77AC|nr:hypothetical protein [Pseudomonas sp. NMI4491_12]MCE0968874.1 hypothetical protein [Pseudomonas sp. NMI4491_12]
MMRNFLLTYSVRGARNSIECERAARHVRDKIASIDNLYWSKKLEVETTFSGFIGVLGSSHQSRRQHAKRHFSQVLADCLNGIPHAHLPELHVVALVDGLGDPIEFDVEQSR